MSQDALQSPRVVRHDEHTWITQQPGTDFVLLNLREDGGVTTLTRFAAGAVGAWHSHPGGEELYVLSGRLDVGGETLGPGDYMFTPRGGRHRVVAHEPVLLLVHLPEPPVYDGEPAAPFLDDSRP